MMPHSHRHAQNTFLSHVGTCKLAVGATTGHARGAYGSVQERLSKARTAFPVGPLARVGGGCMELDVPALITGGRHSVLVIQAATGVSCARDARA